MARIKITISKGETHIDVDGVEGTGCQALTEAFVRAMAGDAEIQVKPEYFVELDNTHIEVHEVE